MIMQLYQELKRRRVFRVAAVYAIVGWLLIQVSDVVFPTLEMPEWSLKLVVLLVILGFPIALVLSWAFDITPTGVRRTDAPPASDSDMAAAATSRRAFGAILQYTGASVIVVLLGFAGYARFAARSVVTDELRSIAVLPFVNMSGDAENEYFSDGLSEELLNALAKMPELSVAARTSSFAYKGRLENVRDIARALGVTTVLEGSVRKAGNRVRITAQLIRADNGYHLWSETFDRELDDIFAIQEEIARSITDALKVKLTTGLPRLVEQGTHDIQAYDFYLKGRYALSVGSSEAALRRAVELFQQAIRRDAQYSLAFAGLADAYVALEDYTNADEVAPLARNAAMRAIELDDSRGETHTALAHVSMHYDFDWAATERAYRRAVELAPHSPNAHSGLAHLLFSSGDYDGGLAEVRRAIELQRHETLDTMEFHAHAATQLAYGLVVARRFVGAITEARRALQLDPANVRARRSLVIALLANGDTPAALEALQQTASPDQALLGFAFTRMQRTQDARRILGELRQHAAAGHVPRGDIALVHLGLGETGEAIDAFEQAYRLRDTSVLHVRLNPLFDPLWQEPRFLQLMKLAGVPLPR